MLQLLRRFFSIQSMAGQDMIRGSLPPSAQAYKTNFNIAWPSALEAVLVSLIASVDTIMVGGLGSDAISAVGITNQPKFVVLALIFSLNIGVTAVVARRKGAEDRLGANRCLKQTIMLSTFISLIVGLSVFFNARSILIFAGAQPDFLEAAITYFQIILVGNFFASIGLTINAAQRGIGNTKVSLRTNLAANGINLVFNYLLINGKLFFPMLGVKGAAIATAMGNFVAFAMALYSVWPRDCFISLRFKCPWRFDRETLESVMSVSASAVVEQLFLRLGMFTYAKIVAQLGTAAFTTHQICMNILNLSFSFGDGLGIASSSLVGQSLGAQRPDLAIIYGKVGQRFAFIISIFLSLLFTGAGGLLISLFSSDPEIISLGSEIMVIISITTLAQTSQVVYSGCLRGAGDTAFVAILSLVSITFIRPFISWFLCYPIHLGLIGAWIGLLADQLLRLVMTLWRFRSGKWTKIRL